MVLQRGVAVVEEVATKLLQDLLPPQQRPEGTAQLPPVTAVYLAKGALPAPTSCGHSCVYVLMTEDGLYCGETDDIYGRAKTHHSKAGVHGLAYVPLPPPAAKSQARAIEARAIQVLRERGFVLASDKDAEHRHFARHSMHTGSMDTHTGSME
jgi:hypothetical protein